MKSDQEFLDDIYEKAKKQLAEKKEMPVNKTRRNQRKFIAAAAVMAFVLISFPMLLSNIFSVNGDTIKHNNAQRHVEDEPAKSSMEEQEVKGRSIKTFFTFYGTVMKIEEVSKKRKVSLLVEVNPDTGYTLFEGETIDLLDINKLVKKSLIGSRLRFEVTQEGEEYQIDNYSTVE